MITILNRLFPEELSRIIYNFVIKKHVDTIVYGKIYSITLAMEKIIKLHQHMPFRDICLIVNFDTLRHIDSNLTHIHNKFVITNHYEFCEDTKIIIRQFLECLNKTKDDRHLHMKAYANRVYDNLIKMEI
jgi:hypothetical protein